MDYKSIEETIFDTLYFNTGRTIVCVLQLHNGMEVSAVYEAPSDIDQERDLVTARDNAHTLAKMKLWDRHLYYLAENMLQDATDKDALSCMPGFDANLRELERHLATSQTCSVKDSGGMVLHNTRTGERLIMLPSLHTDYVGITVVNSDNWLAGPFYINLEELSNLSDML